MPAGDKEVFEATDLARPVLVLLDHGDEPRVTRRYTFTVGRTSIREVRIKTIFVTTGPSSWRRESDVTWRFEVAVASAEGPKARLQMKILAVESRPPVGREERDKLQAAFGASLVVDVGSDGEVASFGPGSPPPDGPHETAIVEKLLELWLPLLVPLPKEPIGVGARWSWRSPSRLEGCDDVHVYRLTAVGPHAATITSERTLDVARHSVDGPGDEHYLSGRQGGATTFEITFDDVATKASSHIVMKTRSESPGLGARSSPSTTTSRARRARSSSARSSRTSSASEDDDDATRMGAAWTFMRRPRPERLC